MSRLEAGSAPVSVTDVHVTIDGRRVLEGVYLHVARGEIVGLMGPNGSGKSTLVDVIAGRRRPHRGIVRICGEDVARLSSRERALRGLGVVVQGGRVLSHLSVADHLRLGALASGRERSAPDALLRGLTAGLAHAQRTGALDRASRLRLELATVIATAPRLLLLDEPTAGLDRVERAQFVRDMEAIRIAFPDMGVLIVEHDGAFLAEFASRVIRLEDGMIALCPVNT